jgi:catalase
VSTTRGPYTPRGLAIKFTGADGTTTDIVGHSFNGFPTATTDQFRELLLAIGASGAGAAKPTALERFLDAHPIAKTFLTTQKLPASFATICYFGVNAFKLTNASGASRFARYRFVPLDGEFLLTKERFTAAGPEYLHTELRARLARQSVRFQLLAQLAEKTDAIEDPSIAWPDSRTQVLLGTIELTRLGPNTRAQDQTLVFMPGNLPAGIEPADPMVPFRSSAYPISFRARQ